MPFPDLYVQVDGRRTGYVDEGPRGGVPLVLLHGGGFDHAELTWRLTVATLRDRMRLVVPDLPGYGESVGWGGAPHDLADLGRWLVSFLDAIGLDRVDLAGVSMGGGMALWLALEHPGRVRRLMPVGAYGLMPRVPLHPIAVAIARSGLGHLAYRIAGSNRTLARAGLAASYGDPAAVTERAVDELMAVARDQSRRLTFDGFLAAEMRWTGLKSDLTARLGNIACPTMIVHGTRDRLVAVRHGRRAATLIPGAQLRELPTGHWPMRERPDLFAPLVEEFFVNAPAEAAGVAIEAPPLTIALPG